MKIKKIISREWLILVAVVILGLVVYFIGRHLNNVFLAKNQDSNAKIMQNMQYALVGYVPYLRVMDLGLNIAVFGYPVIAFIRFIIWAIKTLKKK